MFWWLKGCANIMRYGSQWVKKWLNNSTWSLNLGTLVPSLSSTLCKPSGYYYGECITQYSGLMFSKFYLHLSCFLFVVKLCMRLKILCYFIEECHLLFVLSWISLSCVWQTPSQIHPNIRHRSFCYHYFFIYIPLYPFELVFGPTN